MTALFVTALAAYGSLACTEHRAEPPSATKSSSYDGTRSETIRGSIVRVEQTVATRARGGRSEGVHVIVRVENGDTVDVHVGPAWFLEDQELSLRAGDTILVIGSRVQIDGAPAVIARKITTPERELVLRDDAGVPRWSMGRRGETFAETTSDSIPLPGRQDMTELNQAEQQALRDALDDEYKAWAMYDQVVRDFGAERPFINIRSAEVRHISALRALFERYGLEVPANTWAGRVPRYASTREACEAGVAAEIANAALYDRLMRATNRSDILAVFGHLQRASRERHLRAFERCATRGGRGRGAGRG
ncbi:MAG: DUF2202 domain-containing protein [Kofleriaceae bacterium]